MVRWFRRDQAKAPTYLRDEFPRLAQRLDACLDGILSRFPDANALAEIMLYVPETRYLVTVAIRPDTATLLPTRIRPDDSIAGSAILSGAPVGGRFDQLSRRPRLLSTRSALAVPLVEKRGGRTLGILTLESKREDALTLDAIHALGGALPQISEALAEIPLADLSSDQEMARFLLDKIERELLFILDPDELTEIYHQVRQAAERLTSPSDVVASILLRNREAQNLGFAEAEEVDTEGSHDWIYPVPNVGVQVSLPNRWDALAEPSITGEVLKSGATEYIPDVTSPSVQGRRKPLPEPYDRGSELNIPLSDAAGPFGALILLSSESDAFSADDRWVAERIARYLAVVTRRIEMFKEPLRPETTEQNQFRLQIREMIDPLYTADDYTRIREIRDKALHEIALEAKARTLSEVSAIVLAEVASDGTEELVWNASHMASDITESAEALRQLPFRLPTSSGLVGLVYRSKKARLVPDVHDLGDTEVAEAFFDAFEGVRSELVVPLQVQGRTKIWGLLDVESVNRAHYTYTHKHWVEFLAAQAARVLEAVELAAQRWFESRLSDLELDLARMRASTNLLLIQQQRERLLQTLIDETREVTGASAAQVYVAVNVYDPGDETRGGQSGEIPLAPKLNTAEGALGAVIASPSHHLEDPRMGLRRHIRVTEGMAGQVMKTRQMDFFKDEDERPDRYLPNVVNAKSALVAPIVDGERVIAVLNMESTEPRWCGDLQFRIAEYAARLASSVLVAYRLSMEKVQADELRNFESEHEHQERPDVKQYMQEALAFAAQLTASPDRHRWGQVALAQDGRLAYAITSEFAGAPTASSFTEAHNQELKYAVFRKVYETCRPCLIPNVNAPEQLENLADLPWKDAQSLLCVPLVHLIKDREPVTIGLLTVASSRAYHLNDGDREALRRLAQTMTHGIQDFAHMYSRVTLTRELQAVFRGLESADDMRPMAELREAIRSIPDADDPNEAAFAAMRDFRNIMEPLQLMGQLPQWHLILSNSYPLPAPSDIEGAANTLTLGQVVDALVVPINTYVSRQIDSSVNWQWDPPDRTNDLRSLRLPSHMKGEEEEEQQILAAAIFGCVAAATSATQKARGAGHEVRIIISAADRHTISIQVEYAGAAVPSKWWTRLPRYHEDETSGMKTVELPERRLVEVGHIAESLGGKVNVKSLPEKKRAAIELLIPHRS